MAKSTSSSLKSTTPARTFSVNHYGLALMAAESGMGIAMGRETLVRPLLAAGTLVSPCPLPIASERGYRSHLSARES